MSYFIYYFIYNNTEMNMYKKTQIEMSVLICFHMV